MNTLIRASAGSGKTHALTTQYLRLLRERQSVADAAGAHWDPAGLLAATFTRKAAGEIFDRIVSRLAGAALDDAACRDLGAAIGDHSLTLADGQDLLLGLCRSLHRVSVGTLDGWFARLSSAYRHELGLGGAAVRLVDPQHPRCVGLRRDALRAVLDRLPPGETHTLLDGLTNGKASSGVAAEFAGLLERLSETLDGIDVGAWDAITALPSPAAGEIAAAQASLLRSADGFRLASWRTALESDLRSFEDKHWDAFLTKGLSAGCRKSPPKYGNGKDIIGPDVVAAYAVLQGEARSKMLAALVERSRAIRDLWKVFSDEYTARRRAEGLLLFSETPRLLRDVFRGMPDAGNPPSTTVDHLMLDEFQDTSDAQWGLLQVFATRAAQSPGSVFVVGDAKQAIYGWRGGRAEIFEQIETALPGLMAESRQESRRSAQTVLDAVNAVFGALHQNPVLADHRSAAARWAAHFQPHRAFYSLPGRVELSVSPDPAPETDGIDPDDASDASGTGPVPHLAACAPRIAAEVRALPDGSTVGVLVRTNKAVAQLTDLLRGEGVDVGGEGLGRVADDPAVEIVLSALLFADFPGHTAAAFHVAHSPLGPILGLPLDPLSAPRACADISRSLRRQALSEGYPILLTRWASALAPYGTPRTCRRLEQLIELAAAWDDPAEPPLSPAAFVQAARKAPVEDPGDAPVRVMTINRAKGLEFDAVFLPDLDWMVRSGGGPCLVKRADAASVAAGRPSVEAVCAWPGKTLLTEHPLLAEAAGQAMAEEVTGLLCLLYVALTRARRVLHMYIPPGLTNASSLSPATLLCAALAPGTDAPPGNDWTTLFRTEE